MAKQPTLRRDTGVAPTLINEGTLTGAAKGVLGAALITGVANPVGASIAAVGAVAGSVAHKNTMEKEARIGEEAKPPSLLNKEALVAFASTLVLPLGALLIGTGPIGAIAGAALGVAVTGAAANAGKSRMDAEYQDAQQQNAMKMSNMQQAVGANRGVNQALAQTVSYKNSAPLSDIQAGHNNPVAGGFAARVNEERAAAQLASQQV